MCFRISDKFDNELRQPRYTNNSSISRKKTNSKTIIVVKHDQITEVQAYIYIYIYIYIYMWDRKQLASIIV